MDNKKSINKILIINLGGIGDVLLSTPGLKALHNYYSGAEMSMLVSTRAYSLVNDLPYISDVHRFDIGYGGKTSFANLTGNLRTLVLLRRMKFDLVVNMRTLVSREGARKIKLILGIINARIKAGRDTEGRGSFFDIKIPETDKGEKYEMEYDIDIAKTLGADGSDRDVDFVISDKTVHRISELLEKEGISSDDILIGIHPGGMPSRRWPARDFSKAMTEIENKLKCRFVVTGSKDESSLAEELVKRSGIKTVNMTGKLNIKETGALIKRCNVYIANDTGTMHIASILKTPLVAILGPGDIVRFDPRNISKNAVVLYKKADCSPCNKMECESKECLRSITAGEVAAAVCGLVNKNLSRET